MPMRTTVSAAATVGSAAPAATTTRSTRKALALFADFWTRIVTLPSQRWMTIFHANVCNGCANGRGSASKRSWHHNSSTPDADVIGRLTCLMPPMHRDKGCLHMAREKPGVEQRLGEAILREPPAER